VTQKRDVIITAEPATAAIGVAARVSHDVPGEVVQEIRQLLLGEDAMLNVAAWARWVKNAPDGLPADRRARAVAAAGIATMFWRPFVKDDERKRLEPEEWCTRIADNAEHAEMFERIRIRRHKVLAHSDTNAGVVNVTDTYRIFQRRDERDPYDLRVYDVGAGDRRAEEMKR